MVVLFLGAAKRLSGATLEEVKEGVSVAHALDLPSGGLGDIGNGLQETTQDVAELGHRHLPSGQCVRSYALAPPW